MLWNAYEAVLRSMLKRSYCIGQGRSRCNASLLGMCEEVEHPFRIKTLWS